MVRFLSANLNAAAPHLYMSALWMRSRGVDIECVGPTSDGAPFLRSPIASVPVIPVPVRPGGMSLWWHIRFAARTALTRARVPGDTTYFVSGSLACPAAFFALAFVGPDRIVYQTQDYLEPGRHLFWEWFERAVARRAAFVISNDACRARFMQSHYRLRTPPRVIRTALPNSWPVPDRDEHLRRSILDRTGTAYDGAKLIAAGGGYSDVRCGRVLLNALRQLPPTYVLVYTGIEVGSSSHEATLRAAAAAGVSERVATLGHLDYQDLLKVFAACDIGMLLYPNDGIGNFFQAPGRLTEYARAGVPIVASQFPTLELAVHRYGLGTVCNQDDPLAVASAIQQLGSRPDTMRRSERERLRAIASGVLAFETDAAQLLEVLQELRARRNVVGKET